VIATPTPTATATPDKPAVAIWTAPTGAVVGKAVTLDGSASTGDGTLTCTWSFEDATSATVWETASGCKITKTFSNADTKYVRLTVVDADGDSNASLKSFAVSAAAAPTPTATPTPTRTPTPTPTPTPTATPDQPVKAIWTAPTGAVVSRAVTLDGTASTGDGTLTCTWSFEDETGATVWETANGCKITKTFTNADTKYVELTVRDADGDTDVNRKSFSVARF
jgi:hypothetical protein